MRQQGGLRRARAWERRRRLGSARLLDHGRDEPLNCVRAVPVHVGPHLLVTGHVTGHDPARAVPLMVGRMVALGLGLVFRVRIAGLLLGLGAWGLQRGSGLRPPMAAVGRGAARVHLTRLAHLSAHLEHHAPLYGAEHGEVDEGLCDDGAHDAHLEARGRGVVRGDGGGEGVVRGVVRGG